MKKSFIFIATMFAMTACFSDNTATNDSVSVANADTIIASNKEYLDIKTTIFEEMDKEDRDNVDEAMQRMRLDIIFDENGLAYLPVYHDSLNMSRKIYDFIKKANDHGNYLREKGRNSTAGGF